jgi:hypothetical protein
MRIRTFQLCTERPLPAPVSMTPSGSQVTSHLVPKRHGHNGRGRFRDPTPPLSNSDQDVAFGGSVWETLCHQLPAPRLRTSQQRASPKATDEVPEVTPVRSRSSRDLPDRRRQHTDSGIAHRDIHPRRKRQAVIHDFDYATSEEDSQVSNEFDEDFKEVSFSDHEGNDYH